MQVTWLFQQIHNQAPTAEKRMTRRRPAVLPAFFVSTERNLSATQSRGPRGWFCGRITASFPSAVALPAVRVTWPLTTCPRRLSRPRWGQLCAARGTGAMRCVTRRSDCTTGGIWRTAGGRGGCRGFPAQSASRGHVMLAQRPCHARQASISRTLLAMDLTRPPQQQRRPEHRSRTCATGICLAIDQARIGVRASVSPHVGFFTPLQRATVVE